MTAARIPKTVRRLLRRAQMIKAKRLHTHRCDARVLEAVMISLRTVEEERARAPERRAARARVVDVATARRGRRRATLAAKRRLRTERLFAAVEGMIR